MAILSGSEFQYLIVLGKNEYLQQSLHAFAMEMSSGTQNWLKIFNAEGQNNYLCEIIVSRLFVRLIFSGSTFNCPIIPNIHPFLLF